MEIWFMPLEMSFTFDFKKLLENALRFVTDSWIFCHAQPISLAWADLQFWKCNANCKLMGFRINFFQKWCLCPLFCVCLLITVGLSTVARQLQQLCFQFWLSGPSLCATVDFLVLEVFNSNNLLSKAVVGLKLFYHKSFRKQFLCVPQSA